MSRPFESICLNYVLHCLPGSFSQKEKVISNLKAVMAPDGVLFGSTILGEDAAKNGVAKSVLEFYNSLGIFIIQMTPRKDCKPFLPETSDM